MHARKTILENGLRIITVPMHDNPTVTVLALVEAGSHYEDASVNGISHFLEHMCFKGTDKRPTSFDISNEFDSIGAQSNAFTWYEFTGYYGKAGKQHTSQLIDIVSDLYLNPTLPAEEMEKEKGVIIEEINMYEDRPMDDADTRFDRVLFGDQPAGWSILGPKENIKNMTRDNFVSYRDAHYVPEATAIVVAGDFEEGAVIKDLTNRFAKLPAMPKVQKPKVEIDVQDARVLLKYKKSDQSHFVLGSHGFAVGAEDAPATRVLAAILGQGMSSRLFKKLRDDMGVCYYVRANHETHTDHGKFMISSGVTNERLIEVLQVILNEAQLIMSELVSEEELKKAQEFIIGNMLMGHESSNSVAEWYGMQDMRHLELMSPQEVAEKIRMVTAEDVQRVAQKVLASDQLHLSVVGPSKDESVFEELFR